MKAPEPDAAHQRRPSAGAETTPGRRPAVDEGDQGRPDRNPADGCVCRRSGRRPSPAAARDRVELLPTTASRGGPGQLSGSATPRVPVRVADQAEVGLWPRREVLGEEAAHRQGVDRVGDDVGETEVVVIRGHRHKVATRPGDRGLSPRRSRTPDPSSRRKESNREAPAGPRSRPRHSRRGRTRARRGAAAGAHRYRPRGRGSGRGSGPGRYGASPKERTRGVDDPPGPVGRRRRRHWTRYAAPSGDIVDVAGGPVRAGDQGIDEVDFPTPGWPTKTVTRSASRARSSASPAGGSVLTARTTGTSSGAYWAKSAGKRRGRPW